MDVDLIPIRTYPNEPYARLELNEVEPDDDKHPFPETTKEPKKVAIEDQTCRCKSPPTRKLVVCIDGTSNKFDREKNTNVIRLYSRIAKSDTQLTYYNSGIGTYARPSYRSWKYLKQVIDNKIDLAIAWNLEKVILGAYRWLSENYKDGDQIYLFGFSRGAYQVRVLAGMIETVGLLHAGNEEQIPFAFELYADLNSGSAKESREKTARRRSFFSRFRWHSRSHWEEIQDSESGATFQEDTFPEAFKKIFSRLDVIVHFVGAWDTVSSVGMLRGRPLSLTDTCDHVCFFRHALALDERRVKFLPEYVNPPATGESKSLKRKEVWFAGSHSQIGGASGRYAQLKVAEVPLLWMENEARKAGLEMLPSDIKQDTWEELPEESLSGGWWLLELIPFLGLSYDATGSRKAILPNFGKGRTVREDQLIHASVAFKPSNIYKPRAVLRNGNLEWKDLIGTAQIGDVQLPNNWHDVLEMDLFDHSFAKDAMSRLQSSTEQERHIGDLDRLIILAWSADGRQAIMNVNQSLLTILGHVPNGAHAVSERSIKLLHLLSNQFDNYGHSPTEDGELTTVLSSATIDEVFKKLLPLRPNQPQLQLAILKVVLLLMEQVESRDELLKVAPGMHLVQLLDHWIPTAEAGILNLATMAIARLSKAPEQADLLITAGVVPHLLQLVSSSTDADSTTSDAATDAIACIGDVEDMKVTMALKRAVYLTPDRHPAKPASLNILGRSFGHHFERLGTVVEINYSISAFEDAVRLAPDGHPGKYNYSSNLGNSFLRRFEGFGNVADINGSILAHEDAVRLAPDGHPAKAVHLSSLGRSFLRRFERFGNVPDVDRSITAHEDAVRVTPDGHPHKSAHLSNLGRSFLRRFERLGNVTDVDRSISAHKDSVGLTPDGHPAKPAHLSNLGHSYLRRFERLGHIADVDESISALEGAVQLIPDGHPYKPAHLNNIGSSLLGRFMVVGNLADIDKSISALRAAVKLTPSRHTDKPARLSSLSRSLLGRFERLGHQEDIDNSISALEEAVQLTQDDLPYKSVRLRNLGGLLLRRFERSGNAADADRSISALEDAVRLTPDDYPDKPAYLNDLGGLLLNRFEHFGNVTDIHVSISALEGAVRLAPDKHPDKSGYLNGLGRSFLRRFEHLKNVTDVDRSVSVHKDATLLTPDGHPYKPAYLSHLGGSLLSRFERLGDVSDVDSSISAHEDAVRLTPDGHPYKPAHLSNLGDSLRSRFERLGDIMDVDISISMFGEVARLTTDGHPYKPVHLSNLSRSLLCRFERLGDVVDVNTSISALEEAVRLTPDSHHDKPAYLSNLGGSLLSRFDRFGDVADVDKSISVHEDAARLTPNSHPYKPAHLSNIGRSFLHRFERTGDYDDLNISISILEDAVRLTADDHPGKPDYLSDLGRLLLCRFETQGNTDDMNAAIHHFSLAAGSSSGPPSTRLCAALRWADCRTKAGAFPLDSYSIAVNLLPHIDGQGLSHRPKELTEIDRIVRDAAAAAIATGRYEAALEWLERGRSIVQGQLVHLSSPVDSLRAQAPDLADRLQQFSRYLERDSAQDDFTQPSHSLLIDHQITQENLAQSNHQLDRGSNQEEPIQSSDQLSTGLENTLQLSIVPESTPQLSMEEIGRRHRQLVLDWDHLVQEIRVLPGYQDFLRPKLPQFKSAARSGPVVVISVHKLRCDALILLADEGDVIHVPLKDFSYDLAEELKASLDRIRPSAGSPDQPGSDAGEVQITPHFDETFSTILSALWFYVAKPVLEGIAFPISRTDEPPRIWWCPTGPLTSLPLHAAGIYDKEEPGFKISDYVVSSYTPSLAALLDTPRPMRNEFQFLTVSQPPTPDQAPTPNPEQGLVNVQRHAGTLSLRHLEAPQATVERVVKGMKKCSWIHFACHAAQDVNDSTKSALLLQDGRLTLSEIVKISLPHAEFAFLTDGHVAKGDGHAIYLAEGMLLAGYRSVVTTTWSIDDSDVSLVMDEVYAHLFEGQPDYTRAAYALHHALWRLRESGAPFRSWVRFIHVGM